MGHGFHSKLDLALGDILVGLFRFCVFHPDGEKLSDSVTRMIRNDFSKKMTTWFSTVGLPGNGVPSNNGSFRCFSRRFHPKNHGFR